MLLQQGFKFQGGELPLAHHNFPIDHRVGGLGAGAQKQGTHGVVHRTTKLFKNTVVSGVVTTTSGQTPSVRFGDWTEWGSGS